MVQLSLVWLLPCKCDPALYIVGGYMSSDVHSWAHHPALQVSEMMTATPPREEEVIVHPFWEVAIKEKAAAHLGPARTLLEAVPDFLGGFTDGQVLLHIAAPPLALG